jgi:hypothetical protein
VLLNRTGVRRRAAPFVNLRNWAGHRRRPAALVVAKVTQSSDQNLQRKAYEDLRFRMTCLGISIAPRGKSVARRGNLVHWLRARRRSALSPRAGTGRGRPIRGLPAQQGAALTNAGSPPRQPQLSEARDVTNANAAHKDVSAARGIATTRRRNSHFKKVSLLSGDVSSGDNRGSLILINPTPAVS